MNAVLCIAALVGAVAGLPLGLLDSNDAADTGSAIKQYIQPFEDLHVAGTDHSDSHGGSAEKEFEVDDDEKGFYKSKSNKGNKGYKHFDSFHKKGGDKYGFEKHSAFGHKRSDGNGATGYSTSSSYDSKDNAAGKGKSAQLKKPKDHKAAGTDYSYSHHESDGDDSGHYEGDDGHYESDHGNYSGGDGEHSSFEGEGDSGHYDEGDSGHYDESDSGHYDGGESSGAYHEGSTGDEGSSAGYHQHGSPGATSYYIRHY